MIKVCHNRWEAHEDTCYSAHQKKKEKESNMEEERI